ncbi:response regulator transcription factor [Pseudonocardia sp. ICBG1293]|uniref:response regulator n=1 Tax=Pseudonocardia sp. ICBG1293 TaxID=2844382 RepID=UPI001CCEBD02|nr:response regulator transcription factor [Pseudonocardia sp. ICBG1293]
MTVRVLVVDDMSAVRVGIRMILDPAAGIEVVGEAADGAMAVEMARRLDVDVALMDVRMPGTDGLTATRMIVGEGLCEVLMLTTFGIDEYVMAALRAGAAGFLLKTTPADRLVEAVHSVARGDGVLSPEVTRELLRTFSDSSAMVGAPAGVADLTGRECEVLACLGRGLSNADIACDLYITETTVKSHVSRVMAKIGVRSRLQAAVIARQIAPTCPAVSEAADRAEPVPVPQE